MENRPAVITRLAGGLGNQLFMYAFGKALAERNGVPLKLDVTAGFRDDKRYRRTHLLEHILPPEPSPTRWESRLFPFGRTVMKLDRKVNARLPLEKRYLVQERSPRFDPEIHDIKIVRPTFFSGYWQAPQYFVDMSPPMAERINFPGYLTDPISDEATKIRNENAVCIAIRRYEEVPNPKHYVLPLYYFQQAISQIEEIVDRPHFFVFAQNMRWARENIKSRAPITFAQEKDLHTGVIQDLYLMSQCKHFVLSNSSLHWWAAWLNHSSAETVIVPTKGWLNTDLILPHWTQSAC